MFVIPNFMKNLRMFIESKKLEPGWVQLFLKFEL